MKKITQISRKVELLGIGRYLSQAFALLKINYKIREHSIAKVPIIFSIGDREVNDGTVNLRRLGSKATNNVKLTDAIDLLKEETRPPDY